MVRNILLSLLLLPGAIGIAAADEPAPPAAVQEMATAADTYDESAVPDVDTHLNEVYSWLDFLDGRILAGDIEGDDTWLVFWNAGTQSLEATLNDEPVELIQSEDALGRITFESALISGWIDIADGYVQAEVSLSGEPTLRYVGLLTEALDEPDPQIPVSVVASKKECVCKGTNEANGCTPTDCSEGQACSYTKSGTNHNSKCIYAHVPVKKITPAPPESLEPINVEPALPAAQ